MSKIPLSISLVKENVSIENILRDINTSSRLIENVGVLYYKESQKKKSKVVQDFFCNKLTADEVNKLYTAVVQAALLVRRQIDDIERSFLVTFGMGRNLIKTECLQDKFGMHVVLNSIDPETVKSVDINVLESVPMHDRIQSTKYSKINLFNINPERDLLREVTGKTVDAYKSILGDIVTGADSLRISIEVDINSLPERLEQIFNISQLDVYKRNNFGFIDNISPIKDLELRNILNEKVVQRLNDRELELVWISLPDVVDWKEINTIRYTRKGKDYFELDVKTILTDVYKDDPVDIDTLHKKRVFVVNQAGYSFDNWSIYKCLCADVEYEQKQYILSNGQWYLIEEDFAQAVNNYYNNALVAEHTLDNAIEDEVEEKYNKRVVGLDDKRLLMDKKLVNPYHLKDKVELCDILTTDKELIHVKRYSGSSTLSHLFNQGLVSGELLRRREFRNQVNSKLDEIVLEKNMADLSNWKFEQEDEAFRRVNYKIIFAIITKLGDKKPSIPFFSKVAFRHVCERLKDYGYQVSLMKIGINRVDN